MSSHWTRITNDVMDGVGLMEALINSIKPLYFVVASITIKVRIPAQKTKYQPIACILRDCRKSPIMAILAISHVMKSICYKHQVRRFRVFRQSLRVSQVHQYCRYARNNINISDLK
jgi:hypothetical protein